ncbi:MAG: leucine-rich repeat domain-containing protein [Mariniblastus sp.]|nr:leucine-rich repeat domain-containing protein [Mariniblastus sp.]
MSESTLSDPPHDPPTDKQKTGGIGQKIFRFILAIIFIIALGLGALTMRVNAQREAVKLIQESGGDVSFALERDANNRSLSPDQMKQQPMGWLLNYVPVDFVSSVSRINLGSGKFNDLEVVKKFPKVTRLVVDKNSIKDLSPLASLKDLQVLSITDNPVSDLSPLAGLNKLEKIEIEGSNVSDLSPLSGKPLVKINVAHTQVTNLSVIEEFTNLTELRIDFTDVADLSSVAKLEKLTKLNIQKTLITDLSPLKGLLSLESLDIEDTNITEVTALHQLTSLKWLTKGDSQVSEESFEALRTALPNIKIGTKKFNYGR